LSIPDPSNGAPIRESSEVFSLSAAVGFEVRLTPPCTAGSVLPVKTGEGADVCLSNELLEDDVNGPVFVAVRW